MHLADPSFASPILAWLATFLIHSTLWIGGAGLVARRVDSATWRERLWRGSIAGGFATSLLVLALPTASFGWSWEMPARNAASSSIEGTPSAAAAPQSLDHDAPARLELAPRTETSVPTDSVHHEQTAATGWTWPSLHSTLLGLWIAGAAIGLAQLAWAHARLARVLRSRRPLEAGTPMEALQRIASQAGLRGCPRLSTSSSLASPIALARAEIVVPERAFQRLGAPELESLLGHELAHLARRDPWCLLALNVLRRVLWFQPLLSLATARAVEAAEMRCDELSARWTRGELALARCLAEVATWIEGRPATRLVAGMAEQPSALVERVERLLHPRRRSRSQGKIAVLWLLGMLGAFACAGPEIEPAPTKAPEPEAVRETASSPHQEAIDAAIAWLTKHRGAESDLDQQARYLASLVRDDTERQRRIDMADVSKVEALVGSSLHVTRGAQDGRPTLSATPHILTLHSDGSIDCSGTQLVAPNSVDDDALKHHLESIAAAMPASRPNLDLPPFPYGPLVVRADPFTSHAQLHRVLQLNAGPDVGIRTIELGITGATPMAIEAAGEPVAEGLPLPDGIRIAIFASKASVATSAPLGQRLRYKLERQQTAYLTNVSGYIGIGDLEDIRSKLREIHAEGDGRLHVSLDAAPEVLCSEVLAVAEVAREVGFERIVLAVAPQER